MDDIARPLGASALLILGGLSLPFALVYSLYSVRTSIYFGGSSLVIPVVIFLLFLFVIALGVSVLFRPEQSSLIGYISIGVGLSVIPIATALSYIGLTTGAFPIFPQHITGFTMTILEKVFTIPLGISVVLITTGGILCVLRSREPDS